MTTDSITDNNRTGGILGRIERAGNRLPDPVVIFLYCILAVIAISVVAAAMGTFALHPTQVAAAFAGVSGGFSANLLPGQLDALLFGITEAAAETILPTWDANIAGNAYFIIAMTFVFLPVIWYITDRVIEPRLAPLGDGPMESSSAGIIRDPDTSIGDTERAGLKRAGWAILAVIALWVFLCIGPGTPLIDESAPPEGRLNPLFQSLVAGFFVIFLAAGWAYGAAAGTVKNHRDLIAMMQGAMSDMAYYLVLSFAAAHFVAMFNWSNLGLIFAIQGAAALESANMPDTLLMASVIIFGAILNLFIGSASAKWALLAPVLVPMLMLVGISPEMSTAAYRVGDSATNIITPLMPYFPLVLVFAQRWQKDFGLGSLVATMLPYSVFLLLAGLALTIFWVFAGLPLGPAAPVTFTMP